MGNWNMTIVGVGAHHNKDNPTDADKMFLEFAEKVAAAGHHIKHASFTYGAAINILEVGGKKIDNM